MNTKTIACKNVYITLQTNRQKDIFVLLQRIVYVCVDLTRNSINTISFCAHLLMKIGFSTQKNDCLKIKCF